jgi:hypothetical protein
MWMSGNFPDGREPHILRARLNSVRFAARLTYATSIES